MPLAHGRGTGDWWCFTPVENGRVCLHRTASSCTNMPSAYLQVSGGPQGGARQRPCGMANPPSHNWCWLGTMLQCLLLGSGGQEAVHDECPDDVAVWATLLGDIVASMTGAVYRPNAVARLLADEGQPNVTVCQCSGWCQCVRRAPKFEWMQQSEMAECWKHMVPKLVRAGVRSLSDYLSHEQWWQRCLACDKKIHQAGGELGMAAQVLHVTNEGQSVRVRIREGMRGRSLGRPSNAPPPPHVPLGGISRRPLYYRHWCSTSGLHSMSTINSFIA